MRPACRGWCEVETLYDCFARSEERVGGRPCLSIGGTTFSYARLNAAAMTVCASLRAEGLDETLIGLAGGKSPAVFAAMLGILAAGSAYVPVRDRDLPERCLAQARSAGLTAIAGASANIDALCASLAGPVP